MIGKNPVEGAGFGASVPEALRDLADVRRLSLNTVHLDYARTRNCAWRCGVRTRACRVETHLDAWVSRTEICETRGTGVEMSLVSTRHARVRTPRRCLFT